MGRNVNNARLTKSYIESRVSQEEIVSKYLNIPREVVDDCIKYNHLIPSVFRDDDNEGSMGIAYNRKGKLKVRDFGGFGFFEDVYGVVAYVLSIVYERPIDSSKKEDFYFILKHIYKTFDVDNRDVQYDNSDDEIKDALGKIRQRKAIIEIASRSWNRQDKNIWNKLNVGLDYLNTHFVIPVNQYYINRASNPEPRYVYDTKDPCYAYMLGQNRQGIYLIKLYFPLRDRHKGELKFVTNCNVIEGLPNLERDDYDYIIITKSSKDRLSLGSHLSNHSFYGGAGKALRIGVVNLPSENYRLKANEYDWLKKRLNDDGMMISLLDFDETGRNGANYLLETYNIPYIFITRGEFGLENYSNCKDFADLHDYYSNDEIDEFIKQTISYVEKRYKWNKNYSDAYFRRLSDCDLPY